MKNKKTVKKRGWLVAHYGLGTGMYTAYASRQKAEYAISESQCECVLKPVKCTITYEI